MRTSKPLIDHKSESKEVYDIAGQAAFALDQFDAAEQYLKEAQAAGSISETGSQVLLDVGSYKALWEKEKALRDAESQKDDLPRVRIATTQGEIVVELFEDQAPDTVGNFVSLVEKGFYSGLNFHRVLPNFMAQVGCPVGDGSGGPGYEILDEFGREDARMHFRGTLSMAKTETPNSGGSQFFLTFRPTPHLNSRHTVFGRIISGIEVLEKIRRRDPTSPDAPEPDKLLEAVVVRKRAHEYLPKKTGG
ncbi:MAG: peptidylprolyl isomerase [Planctomycetes bacterium]|nr:peptidylprolyl isomerase [Planctomycetota bacterium]